jgi:hypothetical protein
MASLDFALRPWPTVADQFGFDEPTNMLSLSIPNGDWSARLTALSAPVKTVVRAHDLKRRHLNESQRATVAAQLATMKQGQRTDLAEISVPQFCNISAITAKCSVLF